MLKITKRISQGKQYLKCGNEIYFNSNSDKKNKQTLWLFDRPL